MNKKVILILALVLVSSLLVVGCGDDEGEINTVLDDFSEAMVEWDTDILRETLVSSEAEQITDEDADELEGFFEEFEIKEREIEIDGNQAEVSAVIKMTIFGMTDETNDVINLIKEDGNWKIENMAI